MKPSFQLKSIVAASSVAVFALLAAPIASHQLSGGTFDLVAKAQAAEDGGKGGEAGKGAGKGTKGGKSGSDAAHGSGKGGSKTLEGKVLSGAKKGPSADSDSDRPIWAGVKGGKAGAGGKPAGGGTKKGDLYGDLWVILRDANGVPILNAAGQVQPIDASGNLIPLDAEGAPLDPSLTQEVEFSRLSVARAPSKVLTHSLTEAITKITATGAVITLDAAGRIAVNGTTIDSPLENLALYKAIMTNTLPTDVKALLPTNLSAASLLAAASDKTSTLTVDTVVYLNSFLGINTVTSGVTTAYYDFSGVNYDRYTTYKDATASVLVQQADGTYVPATVNIYNTVFSGSTWVDPTATGGADDFAAAANDALRVIQYVHDNAVR